VKDNGPCISDVRFIYQQNYLDGVYTETFWRRRDFHNNGSVVSVNIILDS
jgi:hypothetical protein